MTDDERQTLHTLAEEKGRAERALHGFGHVNVWGLGADERAAVDRRHAELDADVAVATSRYRAFIKRLGENAAAEV